MSVSGAQVRNPAVRQFFEAFETDDEAFRAALHPEIVWYPIEGKGSAEYGIEAAMQDRREWLDTWAEHEFELEEVIEKGDELVVSLHITGRGRSSGAQVDIRFYPHMKVRDGLVVYIYDHETRAAALEAAGLDA